MSKQSTAGLAHHLSVGQAISISPGEPSAALAATITKIASDEIWLELWKPTSKLPFQEGEQVRIKYWDDEAVYYFDSKILKVSGSANQHVGISGTSKEVLLQRRMSFRVHSAIPFSFTVIDAAETRLISKKVPDARTQNFSVGGLNFETSLPLKVGDQLEMTLQLPPSQQVNAVAWVVHSEPVERDGKYLNSIALKFLHLEVEEQKKFLQFLAQSEMTE